MAPNPTLFREIFPILMPVAWTINVRDCLAPKVNNKSFSLQITC